MKKLLTLIAALAFCSSAFAESLLYVCERPAWDGKDGCGPNNTYATYTMRVDTRDFDDEEPVYVFQGGKGCDVSKKTSYRYHFIVKPETLTFKFAQLPKAPRDKLWTAIKLDRETMKAELAKVDHSSELTCRVEKVTD
jgi:hypothetical protein